MKQYNLKTPNLLDGTAEEKRAEILCYFNRTFALEEELFSLLKNDSTFYLRADSLRHPLIFYFGHTPSFFVNKLVNAKLFSARINPELESIFAIGVDEMSWDDLNESNYNWPAVSEVRAYRELVKKEITNLILNLPLEIPITWESPFWPIVMGIEHQNIHIETSSVLIRQLPINEINVAGFGQICRQTGDAPENKLQNVPGGIVTLGKPENHSFYGWDLEYGSAQEKVSDFKVSQFLVSNGEFLEFVNAGGYAKKQWWTGEGWSWREFKKAEFPLFWIQENGKFLLRLTSEIIPMQWNFPVEINYLEAKAFCNWKSAQTEKKLRMPTEAEWYRMVDFVNLDDINQREPALANLNLEEFASPCPVNLFGVNGIYDVVGNVWQWTETPLTGFPGFKVHPLYDDFSTPTFDGKHNLIKGGSWISTGNEATLHARYAFRRHFYQHAGFRYIESDDEPKINIDSYFSDADVVQSLDSQYGETFFGFENPYVSLSAVVKKYAKDLSLKSGLILNADTGRLAYELAPYFEKLIALDFSARFIEPAIALSERGFVRYAMPADGELQEFKDIKLSDLNLAHSVDHVPFLQGDAANLKPVFSGYDLIICVNQLEELTNPVLFLNQIHKRLNSSGILVLVSHYQWNDNLTPKENRLGGFKKDGENLSSQDGVLQILSENFEQIDTEPDLHFVTRLSARRFDVKKSSVLIVQKK